jgi:hypothetical protein
MEPWKDCANLNRFEVDSKDLNQVWSLGETEGYGEGIRFGVKIGVMMGSLATAALFAVLLFLSE